MKPAPQTLPLRLHRPCPCYSWWVILTLTSHICPLWLLRYHFCVLDPRSTMTVLVSHPRIPKQQKVRLVQSEGVNFSHVLFLDIAPLVSLQSFVGRLSLSLPFVSSNCVLSAQAHSLSLLAVYSFFSLYVLYLIYIPLATELQAGARRAAMSLQDASKPSRKQILAEERKKHGAYDPARLAKLLPPYQRLTKRRTGSGRFSGNGRLHLKAYRILSKRDGSSGHASSVPSDAGAPLPPAPDHSGVDTSTPPPDDQQDPVPTGIPQINYGSAAPAPVPAPPLVADAGTTHDDTSSAPSREQSYTLTSADTSSGSNGTPATHATDESHLNHRMIGMICGLVTMLAVLFALGYFFKRYRQKLTAHYCAKESPKRRKRKKSQRLGSIDGLRSVTIDQSLGKGGLAGGGGLAACEDKTGSSDYLVTQVKPGKAGPFDRAISTMFPNETLGERKTPTGGSFPKGPFDKAISNMFSSATARGGGGGHMRATKETERQQANYLSVALPTIGLRQQRSLDSIAEVQEPPSVTSTQFPLPNLKRNSATQLSKGDATPKRLTWSDRQPSRPMTSPGRTSAFGSGSPSSTLAATPDSKSSKKVSPARPQSAKGGDIEMTRQGSKLVIRDRPSTATLRRPLSSAGNSFRSALRKTRGGGGVGGGVGGEDPEEGAICIETDDIISRPSDKDHHDLVQVDAPPRITIRDSVLSTATSATTATPATLPMGKRADHEGVFELATPPVGRGRTELRSHFSSSTLRTLAARESYATTISPSGSFSFEIKDAVRQIAPLGLRAGENSSNANSSSSGGNRCLSVQDEAHAGDSRRTDLSVGSFVTELDWDLRDCTLTNDSGFSPPQLKAKVAVDS